MTYLVTENCIKCKYTDCVEVCPVDCFIEGPNFLAINPDECIDCAICVPECPANAIFSDLDPSIDSKFWLKINSMAAEKWPSITQKKSPPSDADEWKDKPNKLKYFEQYNGDKPFSKL